MKYSVNNKILRLEPSDVALLKKHGIVKNLKSNAVLRFFWDVLRKNLHRPSAEQKKDNRVGDLVVIFRHVYISEDQQRFPSKSRPAGFSHDKCFRNLVETVRNSKYASRVKIKVFYNGTLSEFGKDSISQYIESCGFNVDVSLLEANSALEAVLILLREIKDLPLRSDDVLYLLENDYIHDASWIDEVFTIFSSGLNFDYLSLYDHPDRYRHSERYRNTEVVVTSSRHWQSAPSTCGTFLLKFSTFLRDYEYIYCTKNDHQMFTRLTGKLKRKLLTPIPGLAVHCMSDYLDPLNRFERAFEKDL